MSAQGDLPSYDELSARLAEAEQTLGAIRRGEVDGLVVTVDGEVRVFTLEGADAFYRVLIEQMPEGAAAVTPSGRVLYANSAFASLLGLPPEMVTASDLGDHVQPFQRERLREMLLSDTPTDTSDLVLARSGGQVPVALSISPVEGHSEAARCVVVVDLTARQRTEALLRAADARFRGAFDNAPIGMALLDLVGLVEQANPALCALAGTPAPRMIGRPLPWMVTAEEQVHPALRSLLDGRQETATLHEHGSSADGQAAAVGIHLTLLRAADGTAQHVIAQVQDESARRRHEAQLQHVADHDGLTGLLNRRGFDLALIQHTAAAARYGTEGAVLLLDVDHFKYVNDTRGHTVGDQALIQLAEALRGRLRDSDVIARLGGDEFAVLLPRGSLDAAGALAEQLVQAAREVDVVGLPGRARLTISVGVAGLGDGSSSPGELMALADLAMYDSKEAGRDRVTVYDGEPGGLSTTTTRLTWLDRIQTSVEEGTLLLDAQPIVDLVSGETVQHELLVRLPGLLPGEGDRVPAELWFSMAERYGLAPAIDEWVVDQAFDLLAAGHPALNVNVSATSIGRAAWCAHVSRGLERTGVDAQRITFEITETAAIGNIAAATAFTQDLRSLGCRLALDDFGAGFGSFYYLKHLPFDDVKIDGEFVRDCVADERDRAIIRAMVDVAQSTGRRTIGECIEDEATLSLLRDHHVDMAQGFHLGRPAPVV